MEERGTGRLVGLNGRGARPVMVLTKADLCSYVELRRELAHLACKRDARLAAAETRRWKVVNKEMRRNRKPFG